MTSWATFNFLIVAFISASIQAYDGAERTVLQIASGSQLQKAIDSVYWNLFSADSGSLLCKIVLSEKQLQHDLGISPDTSAQIAKTCHKSTIVNYTTAKTHAKSYRLFLDRDSLVPFSSWTTPENQTYMLFNDHFNSSQLTQALIHELAIVFDAKFQMDTETFNDLEGESAASVNTSDLGLAFSHASFLPVAYTFAALRAFAIEDVVFQRSSDFLHSHDSCQARFREVYAFFNKNLSWFIRPSGRLKFIGIQLRSHISAAVNGDWVQEQVLKKDLLIRSDDETQLSFCQYMSTPYLSTNPQLVALSSGPRPRTGGGWLAYQNLNLDLRNLVKPLKPQERDDFSLPGEDKSLKKFFDADIEKNKLIIVPQESEFLIKQK